MISIVVGLLLSIFGTLMLKDSMPRPVFAAEKDFGDGDVDERRFKL